MKMNRRQFLIMGATAAAILLVPSQWPLGPSEVNAFYQTPTASRFKQPLRGVFPLDPNGIPVAIPDGTRTWPGSPVPSNHYSISIKEYTDKIHPTLPATRLWGFHSAKNLGGKVPQRHLGGIIVAKKGVPIQITFQNELPARHILPVDDTIMGANLGHNRTSVHLHGGEVPWLSDGAPFAWFDPKGRYGSSVANNKTNLFKKINPKLAPGQAEYYYPNNQSARMLWYHDHAVGITRLNAYAGIASAYIIRDDFESSLVSLGLPDFIEAGGNEIPLAIQEKIFVGKDIAKKDPTWSKVTPQSSSNPGSLWYAHDYEAARWDSVPGSVQPNPSAIPEFFGDTMLVNGVVHPFAKIEPRRYRLRILNATQARFLNLQLYQDDGTGNPILSSGGPDFLVIGTEGGFLANPAIVPSNVPLNVTSDGMGGVSVDLTNPGGSLLTAPGERWDVVVDFAGFGGKSFILYNDAPAPFPGGALINDQNTPAGLTTRAIMRFDVAAATTGAVDPAMNITPSTSLALASNSGVTPFLATFGDVSLPAGVPVRQLTLNEIFDEKGRLIQMLGTNQTTPAPMGSTVDPANPAAENYAREYMAEPTENVAAGSTEVWQIANLTMDTHPMHFHLVNVQVISRQSFTDSTGAYQYANGVPSYTGPAVPPPATELGWKETVKMTPGEVTTVIMKFDLPSTPFAVPASLRTGGNEYVWHCHILEHEEHDMMRPLIVK